MTGTFLNCCGIKPRCIDTRPTGRGIRRRWRCLACDTRWTTLELDIGVSDGRARHLKHLSLSTTGSELSVTRGEWAAIENFIKAFKSATNPTNP